MNESNTEEIEEIKSQKKSLDFPKFLSTVFPYFILLLAIVFRFINLDNYGFSNDELSAISRTHHTNFYDLIWKGVAVDGHPALVQIIYWVLPYYYFNPVTIRFIFALSSVLGLWFYFISIRRWFGYQTAIMVLVLMSFLQHYVLYGQLARPYAIGLCTVPAFLWFWMRIIDADKLKIWAVVGYIIFGTLSLYTHYFAGLFIGILGLLGLLLIKKGNLLKYVLASFTIAILFLPHLLITLAQFNLGGLDWLGIPTYNWPIDYVRSITNYNYILLAVLAAITVLSIVFIYKTITLKLTVLFTAFALSLIIPFAYSVFRSPILQASSLVFSLPVLIAFIWQGLGKYKLVYIQLGAFAFTGFLISNLVFIDKYYNAAPYGQFEVVAKKMSDWSNAKNHNNTLYLADVNNSEYINNYLNRSNFNGKVSLYRYDDQVKYQHLEVKLKNSEKEYLFEGWSNIGKEDVVNSLITYYYPILYKDYKYFNSGVQVRQRSNFGNSKRLSLGFIDSDSTRGKLILNKKTHRNCRFIRADYNLLSLNKNQELCLAVCGRNAENKTIFWKCIPFTQSKLGLYSNHTIYTTLSENQVDISNYEIFVYSDKLFQAEYSIQVWGYYP
ncbi:MAG: glycosyltransferase family 39 protein [Bacteroidota bacterium]|nr:glycosyltransferase family 39 protein [Bacteroidota bacterium]